MTEPRRAIRLLAVRSSPVLAAAVERAAKIGRDVIVQRHGLTVTAVEWSSSGASLFLGGGVASDVASDVALRFYVEKPFSRVAAEFVESVGDGRYGGAEIAYEVISPSSSRLWEGMIVLRSLIGKKIERLWGDRDYVYLYMSGSVCVRWEIAYALDDGEEVLYWDVID